MSSQAVVQGLIARGMPPHIAQGFAGNFAVESGFDPGINERNPLVAGSRGGFGLAQWTGPRRRQLEAWAQQNGRPLADIDTQLDFLMQELGTTESGAWGRIQQAQTPEEAAQLVSERFLRPGIPHLDRRIEETRRLSGMPMEATMSTSNTTQQPYVPMEAQQEGRESLWKRLGIFKDDDRRQRLAMALEGMTLRPNQGLIEGLSADIEGRAGQRSRNRTAEWLRANGNADLADAVEGGVIDGGAAFGQVLQRQQTAEERAAEAQRQNQTLAYIAGLGTPQAQQALEYFNGTGDMGGALRMAMQTPENPDPTSGMQNYEYLLSQGVDPEEAIERAFGGGTTVNVGTDGPQVGTIPQGYELVTDPETGARSMRPIPGGPEDASTANANAAENQAAGAVNVLGVLEDLRADIEANPRATTGLTGSMMRGIPGTQAYDSAATAQTIKANLAFDALAAMRAASPTGGALGAVSERELALLESQIANLDLNQSDEQVLQSLGAIEEQYTRLLRKAYETGDAAALDAALGGRPSFLGPMSGGSDDDLVNRYLGGN